MSHHPAFVRFGRDGVVMVAEFDACVDVLLPNLWATKVEASANWRSTIRRACSCGGMELAQVYTIGNLWPVQACRSCMAIEGPLGLDYAQEREVAQDLPVAS